jgi:hypothetical protein
MPIEIPEDIMADITSYLWKVGVKGYRDFPAEKIAEVYAAWKDCGGSASSLAMPHGAIGFAIRDHLENNQRKGHLQRDPAVYRPQPSRRADPDYWPTIDEDVIATLVHVVTPLLPRVPIWECAGGQGHLVDPLRQAGHEVYASDLHPGRKDIEHHDFIMGRPPECTKGMIGITNGPHTSLTEFIIGGLKLIDAGHLAGFVILSRLGADTTDHRAELFNRAAYEWRMCWRPWWIPRHPEEKQPRFTSQWTAWLRGVEGPPRSVKVRRSEVRGQSHGA